MNKEIEIMIRLQGFWDRVLEAQKNIEKWQENIAEAEKKAGTCAAAVESGEKEIKGIKNLLKQEELLLADLEEKAQKLSERKTIVQNEKELTAVSNELDKILEQKGESEEKIILMIDDIDEKEKTGRDLAVQLSEAQSSYEDKKSGLNEKIQQARDVISENSEKYVELLPELSNTVKARFDKLIKSKNGKAVGEIIGEVCSSCNFQIPSQLVADALKDDIIAVCTNCGRFIYARK